jgi:hypothetical protein
MIMGISREAGRSLGALTGLAIGFLIMWLAGFQGLWPAFWFGTGGAVMGGMSGERLVDRRRQP